MDMKDEEQCHFVQSKCVARDFQTLFHCQFGQQSEEVGLSTDISMKMQKTLNNFGLAMQRKSPHIMSKVIYKNKIVLKA